MVTLAARFRSTPWKRLVGCGHSAWGRLADAPIVRGNCSPLTSDDPHDGLVFVNRVLQWLWVFIASGMNW